MPDEIRSYGPGKFSTIVDAYVYDVSLNGGCDEETGDVSTIGRWYGLMRNGRTIFKDHDPMLETLNEAERDLILNSAGVIISEDDQGFVDVDYISSDEELNEKWSAIETECSEFEAEAED